MAKINTVKKDVKGLVHLPAFGSGPNFTTAICGKKNIYTMSEHEIKRGGITCEKCLKLHNVIQTIYSEYKSENYLTIYKICIWYYEKNKQITSNDIRLVISGINWIVSALKEDRLQCFVRSVSKSGQSRVVSFNTIEWNSRSERYELLSFNYDFFMLGFKQNDEGDIILRGYGLDVALQATEKIVSMAKIFGLEVIKELPDRQLCPRVI